MDRAWREGFAALAPLNLSFEAWMFHSQLGDLIDLARVFPETKIVLNHIGGALGVGPYADKRKEVFEEWRTQISKLGQFPNVYIKLGGLGMPSLMGFEMGQQAQAPSSEQLAQAWRPYIETCIEAFGPRPLDVREQLPGRQGNVQLFKSVERLQAHRRELFGRRKERDVPQHRA